MRNRQPVVLGEEQTESDHGNNDERGGDRSGSGGFQPILAVSELNVSKSATGKDATAEMDLETGVGAPVHSLASSSIPSVENNISTSRKLFRQSNTTSAESDSPPPASLHRSDASDAILNVTIVAMSRLILCTYCIPMTSSLPNSFFSIFQLRQS
ncbi:hypothetical protein BSLG_005911 [Batrachochytrium salamandrivorans]|nr:hypothetical protein BSLG_005911 [Batrachochytrium salamandrivorans]